MNYLPCLGLTAANFLFCFSLNKHPWKRVGDAEGWEKGTCASQHLAWRGLKTWRRGPESELSPRSLPLPSLTPSQLCSASLGYVVHLLSSSDCGCNWGPPAHAETARHPKFSFLLAIAHTYEHECRNAVTSAMADSHASFIFVIPRALTSEHAFSVTSLSLSTVTTTTPSPQTDV